MLLPPTKEALELTIQGAVAMSHIEAAGIRIDVPYLDGAIKKLRNQITQGENSLRSSPEYKVWAKHFGNGMNLRSKVQLGRVMFDIFRNRRNPFMGLSNDMAAFEHLKNPFVREYQLVERLKTALKRNLLGIKKETVDGYLHPFFDLHTAESGRSSSSKPNLHNQPVRDKEVSQIVRTCMIPREGHVFLEMDYGSQEVRISACYHKDPTMISYILGGGDMHKDFALKLYKLTEAELGSIEGKGSPGKMVRYIAKNRYVFAEFYGSYYAQCAPALWDAISVFDLTTASGVSLFEHLKAHGISSLGTCEPGLDAVPGTFEAHVKDVERWMWQERFPVYDQWKKDWWSLYQQQGGINTLTGFKQEGVFRRNQILCDAIQGDAFRCLLWSIIKIQEKFHKYKMKSKIVLQVHDSALFDAHEKEVKNVIEIATEVAIKQVAKHWKWIIVPLACEWEIAEKNWYDKCPYHGEAA